MAASEAIQAREQLLAQLVETLHLGLFHVGLDGSLLYANDRLREITGVAIAATLLDQLRRLTPTSLAAAAVVVAEVLAGAERDVLIDFEHQPGTELRYGSLRMRPLLDGTGAVVGATGTIEDVTDSVRERTELAARASVDHLTGCLNRASVLDRLEQELNRLEHRGGGTGVAAIFVDVDKFKSVNDNFGHDVGDRVLESTAERLLGAVRRGDAVGRLGGDEFLVVCPDITSAEEAELVARHIAAKASGVTVAGPHSVQVQLTVGTTWTDDGKADMRQLVATADAAMYRSKPAHRAS
jgi:diguanylate cyclase (GGDEF)-like protein/PAS domain S-box-containing protein